MMAAKGAVYPVYQLMKDTDEPFDPKSYLPAVDGLLLGHQGNMLSMPFNSSTPVLYFNKDAFKKAGLDPEQAAEDLAGTRGRRQEAEGGRRPAGSPPAGRPGCRSRTSAPGTTCRSARSERLRRPRHAARVQRRRCMCATSRARATGRRASLHLRRPQGRAARQVLRGRVRDLHDSSAAYAAIKRQREDFKFGVGMLPYWADVKGAPQNSIIGGATLWVLSGKAPEVYKGVAKFFTSCRRPCRRTGIKSPATCRSPWRPTSSRQAGLLRQEPRHRRRDQAADAQGADRELQGPAPRQLRADPQRHRRGAGGRLVRQEDAKRRSTTRSSAATSCCASSRPQNEGKE